MATSYQGRDIQKQSDVGLRLEKLPFVDYTNYDETTGLGAVQSEINWLVADNNLYSSSVEFSKESGEAYSASYFLPTVINISGGFYGTFIGSSANISGSLTANGTSSFNGPVIITGSLDLTGALRLDPTEDPGNVLPSSSFIFQSSSNTDLGTDLFFRQNGQVIEFNWLADTLFTSLLYGGVVTYSGSNVYISSGSGIIVDHNADHINESAPSIQYITWPNLSFVPTYLNVRQVTYIAIDSGSNIYQDYNAFDNNDFRDKIVLGAIGHFDLANVTAFQGAVLTTYDQGSQINTFIDAFGPLKLTGYGLTAQPSSFKLSVAAGTSFIHGGFYDITPIEPSNVLTPAQATASIAFVWRNGVGGSAFDTNGGAFYTNVITNLYDNGSGSPASVSNNNWTIQRVMSDPRTGILYIYYGQKIYTTLSNALANLPTDAFEEGDTKNFTTFLGYLVVKSNTTNLASTTDNAILNSGLFRGISGGGGGASGGGSGTPGGSNAEIQYNNGGTFAGSPNFTFISSSSTVLITGSLIVSSSSTFRNIGPAEFTGSVRSLNGYTGSLFGTASWATSALTASFITTASTNAFVQGGNGFGAQAVLGTNDNQSLAFETSGSIRMFINSSSGNVGIGTTTPNYGIHHVGTIGVAGIFSQRDFGFSAFSQISQRASFVAYTTDGSNGIGIGANGTAGLIQAFTGTIGNPSARILSLQNLGGNVSIGTTTDAGFKLDVSGSGRFTNGLTVTGSLIAPSITGSLQGTASFATTASFLLGSVTSASYAATSSLLTGRLSTYRSFGTGSTVGTGTTSLVATTSFLIPANTFTTGDILRVRYRVRKLATNGNTTTGIYINTTNDISTATTLGILTANTTLMQMKRDFYILAATGINTEHVGVGTSLATDDAATGRAASTINWAVDQYIIFGITHTNTNDSGYSTMYYLERV